MDREILFRGKRREDKVWIYGDLNHDSYGNLFIKEPCLKNDDGKVFVFYDTPVLKRTVGEYTGLEDIKGVKIFEGDIIEITNFKTGRMDEPLHIHKPFNLEVIFFKGSFLFSTKNDIEKEFGLILTEYGLSGGLGDSYSVEVIGNVHDSKNLIESGFPLRKRFYNADNS